ncbi:MAG: hypothetical protein P4L96_09620 [Rhodoferax sp.]|nr:hypothetical protein [Rhodoferax sp.]
MASRVTSEFPRPRTLIHPDAFNSVRIRSRRSGRARHIRLALQPGLSLFDALVQPLAAIGIANASTTLLGGFFSQLHSALRRRTPRGAP